MTNGDASTKASSPKVGDETGPQKEKGAERPHPVCQEPVCALKGRLFVIGTRTTWYMHVEVWQTGLQATPGLHVAVPPPSPRLPDILLPGGRRLRCCCSEQTSVAEHCKGGGGECPVTTIQHSNCPPCCTPSLGPQGPKAAAFIHSRQSRGQLPPRPPSYISTRHPTTAGLQWATFVMRNQ